MLHVLPLLFSDFNNIRERALPLHYVISSSHLLLHLSCVQIFYSAFCSQIPQIVILPTDKVYIVLCVIIFRYLRKMWW
jgi:hypothetical protein